MNIAKNIVRARKARKLRPAHLAKALGVSRSTVHAWEHGGPGPKLSDLPSIAQQLGVSVSELVDGRKS